MTQFAGALRAQLNLQVDTENAQSVSPNSASEFLSQTVSSLDLSGAEYGTLLLKDKLHDQAYAYAVVTFKEQQLRSLNTYINNIQPAADQLAATDKSKTLAHAALIEELADREDQLIKSMILSEAANYVLSGAQLSKSNMVKFLNENY